MVSAKYEKYGTLFIYYSNLRVEFSSISFQVCVCLQSLISIVAFEGFTETIILRGRNIDIKVLPKQTCDSNYTSSLYLFSYGKLVNPVTCIDDGTSHKKC